MSLHRVRRLSIESKDSLQVWADGEYITKTPATIEVVPRGLSVVTPD
ncbi:MAG: hypothetical protein ACE5KI_01675 [Dehalococcoidia bacterium]